VHRPAIFPAPALVLRLMFGQTADELFLSSTRVVPSGLLAKGFAFRHSTLEAFLKERVH
jgi:uncharacterized protein